MTREDFRIEIERYISDIYDKFYDHQKILKQIFAEIHRICDKNNIEYYLFYGSLLGLIRDGDDVLPWDFDYDIVVPINVLPRLINALNKDLVSDYYFVSNFTTKNYYLNQIRICKKGYDSEKIHVDIFYIIGAPSNTSAQKKFSKAISNNFFNRSNSLRSYSFSSLKMSPKKKKIIIFLVKNFYRLFYSRTLNEYKFNKLIHKYNYETAEYVLIVTGGARIYPKHLFKPQRVPMGYSDAYISKYSDDLLKLIYGEYSQYPPIYERFDEFYRGYLHIK